MGRTYTTSLESSILRFFSWTPCRNPLWTQSFVLLMAPKSSFPRKFLRTDEAEKLSISHPVSPTVLSFTVFLTPLATYRDYELTVTSLPSVLSWKHNFTVQLQIFWTFAHFQNCSEITHFSWVFVLFYSCYVSEIGKPYGDRASENTDVCQ